MRDRLWSAACETRGVFTVVNGCRLLCDGCVERALLREGPASEWQVVYGGVYVGCRDTCWEKEDCRMARVWSGDGVMKQICAGWRGTACKRGMTGVEVSEV